MQEGSYLGRGADPSSSSGYVRGYDRTEAANKLKTVPLSNDTIRRRIDDFSDDILSQLLDRLRCGGQYCIQLDESTDIASAAQLIALVRYPWGGTILEDFLFCKVVPGRATGEEIFRLLDDFINEAGLTWGKCVSVCTDGAAAMTVRVVLSLA